MFYLRFNFLRVARLALHPIRESKPHIGSVVIFLSSLLPINNCYLKNTRSVTIFANPKNRAFAPDSRLFIFFILLEEKHQQRRLYIGNLVFV